jgi:hypothetical protein
MTARREQTLEDAFTEPPGLIAGLKLRPFSLGTLNLCRRLGLTLFTGQAGGDVSDEEKQRQIVAFLFIQSRPLDEVLRAVRAERFDEDFLLPFSLTLPLSAIPEAVAEIGRIMDAAGAAAVEIERKPGAGAEDAPPNS